MKKLLLLASLSLAAAVLLFVGGVHWVRFMRAWSAGQEQGK